jgi:hypothetical protein
MKMKKRDDYDSSLDEKGSHLEDLSFTDMDYKDYNTIPLEVDDYLNGASITKIDGQLGKINLNRK